MSRDRQLIDMVENEETRTNCMLEGIEKRHECLLPGLKNVRKSGMNCSLEAEGNIEVGSESHSTAQQPPNERIYDELIRNNQKHILISERKNIQISSSETEKEQSTSKDSLWQTSLEKHPHSEGTIYSEPLVVKLSSTEADDESKNKNEKVNCRKLFGERFTKPSMKKSVERRRRIENRKQGTDSFSWISNPPEAGYIRHPDAKLLIHPSFFNEDGFELCGYNERCMHERNCGETRIRIAAMTYIRHKDCTTYRDLELIWGVSRSTIQRKTSEIHTKKLSDLIFLLNP